MLNYIKFWLAKDFAEFGIFLIVLGIFVAVVSVGAAVIVANDWLRKLRAGETEAEK